jgi:hypothetical protein
MEMCGDIIPVTGDSFREKIAEQMRKGLGVERTRAAPLLYIA